CVVGDPAQTIFSFTGATSDHLVGFPNEFPGARTVELGTNYRSTGAVIDLANGIAREIAAALQLAPADPGTSGPVPTLTAYDHDDAEADAVARAIAGELLEGVPADEIAVLFRLRSQAEPIERALQQAGIPYVL